MKLNCELGAGDLPAEDSDHGGLLGPPLAQGSRIHVENGKPGLRIRVQIE